MRHILATVNELISRSQWARNLRRGFVTACLLRLRVRIPPRDGYLSLVDVVTRQIVVSASGWSLVQRSPTESGMSNSVWSWSLDNEEALGHYVLLSHEKSRLIPVQSHTILQTTPFRALLLQCQLLKEKKFCEVWFFIMVTIKWTEIAFGSARNENLLCVGLMEDCGFLNDSAVST
jgi:hypothetical protein